MCDSSFKRLFENLSPTTRVVINQQYDVTEGPEDNLLVEPELGGHSTEFTQHEVPNNSYPSSQPGSINYVELTRVANELIRSAVNDSALSQNIYKNIIMWTTKIRNKEYHDLRFISSEKPKVADVIDVDNDNIMPCLLQYVLRNSILRKNVRYR